MAPSASSAKLTPKMMLGFVVRQCAVALGHRPSAEELAEWANNQQKGRQRYCIFGRAITVDEARYFLVPAKDAEELAGIDYRTLATSARTRGPTLALVLAPQAAACDPAT